ncbi:MAG: hypothetical protein KDB00_15110, partial [Planctomycetales bacterium]|nr:hypothetical protein [Planctomycetales bacterium]
VVSVGSGIQEGMLTSFCVKKTAHRIEFAEIQCENFYSTCVPWVWGGHIVTVVSFGNARSRG